MNDDGGFSQFENFHNIDEFSAKRQKKAKVEGDSGRKGNSKEFETRSQPGTSSASLADITKSDEQEGKLKCGHYLLIIIGA